MNRLFAFAVIAFATALAIFALIPPAAIGQERPPSFREIRELERTADSLREREASLIARAVALGISPQSSAALRASLAAAVVDVPRTRAAHEARRRDLFFAALALPVFVNAVKPFDRDAGGYIDPWNSQDKHLHAAIASGIVSIGNAFGVPVAWAVFGACAASVAFELTQAFPPGDAPGFGSPKDVAWACGSAIATSAVLSLARRWR